MNETSDEQISLDPTPQQVAVEDDLLLRVLNSFDDTPNPRMKILMKALVSHVHAFIREVRLTEQEWNRAIEFLTAAGDITDANRQEFVLLSDVLGASMQTIAVNNPAYSDATQATVFGPFFVENSPEIPMGGDIGGGAPGQQCWVEGTVTDTSGNSVPNARIEVWEADEDGLYDVQYPDGRTSGRAHLFTDHNGQYSFWGLTPTPYPIPHDGPVGELLTAVQRSPVRAAHLHFMVSAPGLRTLVTHIFVAGDQFLDADSVFGVKTSLIREFQPQEPGSPTPDSRDLAGQAWSRVKFDIVLAPQLT